MVPPIYRYRPLPSPAAIRLLELKNGPAKEPLHCALKAFDPTEAPPYHALSYTWGSPLGSFSQKVSRPRIKRLSIFCDDRRLLVTPNLHDALRHLRTEETASRAADAKYFWIDAVCVNQKDILERNSQVARMSSTFLGAQSVIAWLGPEDQFTTDGIALIEKISSIPETLWQSVSYTDFFDIKWHEKVGIPMVTYTDWLGFLALIDRSWFHRAWVVQEMALAESVTLVCGSQRLDWTKLDKTLGFISSRKWYHHLTTEKVRHIAAVQRYPGVYTGFLQSRTSYNLAATTLASTRRFNKLRRTQKAPSFLKNLIYMHRHTEATDPRDKVYAFLGLSDMETASQRMRVRPIVADYALPVQEVYSNAATNLLLSSGNLGLLSQVQDASRTKITGLPSWVPDFSATLYPYPLLYRGNGRWSAGSGLFWRREPLALRKDRLLPAQGSCVDTVEEVALLPKESVNSAGYWAGIVNLALQLPSWYPFSSADYDSAQSRVEALWRTLTANTYLRQYPAPASCGQLFLDYVLNLQIRHTLTPWSQSDGFIPHQTQSSFDEVDVSPSDMASATQDRRIVPAWYDLLEAEPAGSPYSLDSYRVRMADVVERMLRSTYAPVELAQLQHDLDMTSGDARRVFRTKGGLLGAGPRSLRPGDEVWVLAGALVPHVLREVGGGRGTHSLVGECYVHGYMHGTHGRLHNSTGVVDVVLE